MAESTISVPAGPSKRAARLMFRPGKRCRKFTKFTMVTAVSLPGTEREGGRTTNMAGIDRHELVRMQEAAAAMWGPACGWTPGEIAWAVSTKPDDHEVRFI